MSTGIKTSGRVANPGRWNPAVRRGLIGAHFYGSDAASSRKNWADPTRDGIIEGSPVYGDGFVTFNGAAGSQSRMQSQLVETPALTQIFLTRVPATITQDDWPTFSSNGPGTSAIHAGNSTGIRTSINTTAGALGLSVPGWTGSAGQTTNVVMGDTQGAPALGSLAAIMFRVSTTLAEIVNLSNGKRKYSPITVTRDPSAAPFYIGDTLDSANLLYDGAPTIIADEFYSVDLTNAEALAAAVQMQAYASFFGFNVPLASTIDMS